MSNEPQFIKRQIDLPEYMDFNFLKALGVDLSQQLSGDIWTDYNEHDPGVTILEQIVYALTELGFKADFDIEDLFFSNGKVFNRHNYSFYEPSEIFPSAPINLKDYRKLIIDKVYGVKNAWIVPKKQSDLGVSIKGLYEVLLQIEDPEKAHTIRAEVFKLLSANRNLCEDFDAIKILTPKKLTISADININPSVEGETIFAKILFDLYEAFSPQIRFHSLEDLMKKELGLEEIFNGPLPSHGFIQNDDLERSELKLLNRVYRSKLIKLISDVEGVNSVSNFIIKVDGQENLSETFTLDDNCYPVLDVEGVLDPEQGVTLYIGNLPYQIDQEVVTYSFNILLAKFKAQFKKSLSLSSPPPQAKLTPEEIQFFSSIQYTFPLVYGIGEFGVDGPAIEERRAQANQLKGYLLLFEQHYFNFLAQIANVHHLFSVIPQNEKTYFYQLPSTVPNLDKLVDLELGEFEKGLQQLQQKFDPFITRRHQFLDHLLARFGESFLIDSFNAINRQASIYNKKEFELKSIDAKIKFLENYIDISRSRGTGYDYLAGIDQPNNVSGLKKKISLLFNIPDFDNKRLSSLNSNKNIKQERKSKDKAPALKANQFTFSSSNSELFSEILTYGINRTNYIISAKSKDKKTFLIDFIHPVSRETSTVFSGKSIEECENALLKLIEFLKEANIQSEGFHIIEHILLRPLDLRYKFYLRNDKNELLESDYIYTDLEEGKAEFIRQMSELGTDPKNYKVEKIKGEDAYSVFLKDETGLSIAQINGFLIEDSAKKSIEETSRYLKNVIRNNNPPIETIVDYKEQPKAGATFVKDPYSFKISVVLPSWPAKFHNQRLQILFENIIKLHAPAHSRVKCYWLTLDKMAEFEDVHHQWLEVKASPTPAQPMLDDLSLYLLLILIQKDEPDHFIVKEYLPKLRKRFS